MRKLNILLSMTLILMLFGCGDAGARVNNDVDKIDEETVELINVEESVSVKAKEKAELKENGDTTNATELVGNIQAVNIVSEDKELQKFIDANTIDSLLKNYISVQIYDYGINKDGVKTTYFEGYEDIHKNRAVRIKESTINNDITFEKLPYYVKDNGGTFVEVINDDTAPLPKNNFLNQLPDNDIYELNYGRKSIIYNKGKILKNDIEDNIGKLIIEISIEDLSKDDYIINFYKNELSIENIDTILVEYDYDIKTLAINNAKHVVICKDLKDYVVSNVTINYDVDILTPVKVVNDEEGKAVYFDMNILKKANTYNNIKKDVASILINDFIYDKNGKVVKFVYVYKDADDSIVIKDNSNITYVKYEKKWYDISNGVVSLSKLSDDKKKYYNGDPISIALSGMPILDTTEKVITAYEGNNEAVVIQENKNLDANKIYIASTLPNISNVYKTRKEIKYDMDNDIIKSYTLTSYINSDNYKVEDFIMSLDENEPPELNDVINYIDNQEEIDYNDDEDE